MRTIFSIVFVLLILPSVTFAVWWNPFDWFVKTQEIPIKPVQDVSDQKMEMLEKKILELEKKLEDREIAASSTFPVSSPKTVKPAVVQKNTTINVVETKKSSTLNNEDVIELVKPAVVFIETPSGSGSGFIFDSKGYILTNAHVVEDSFQSKVTLSNGSQFSARVVGINNFGNNDVAVLLIEGEGNFPVIRLGNSDLVKQGESAFSFGFPISGKLEFYGIETKEVSFKEGTISRKALSGNVPLFEMSTEIHHGNSGGPLINSKSEVIGINTLGVSDNSSTVKFAIAINHIKTDLSDLKQGMQLIKNKDRTEAESLFRSKLSLAYVKATSSPEIRKVASSAYNKISFEYIERQVLLGSNTLSESQESLRKSYLEEIIAGNKLIVKAMEQLRSIHKSYLDSYSEDSVNLSSISNDFAREKLKDFAIYSEKKYSVYDKKVSEIYSKISDLSRVVENGKLSDLPSTYFLNEKQSFMANINLIATEKDELINRLWIISLF